MCTLASGSDEPDEPPFTVGSPSRASRDGIAPRPTKDRCELHESLGNLNIIPPMPSARHYQWGPAPYIMDLQGFLRGDPSSQANQVTWEKYPSPPPFFFFFFFYIYSPPDAGLTSADDDFSKALVTKACTVASRSANRTTCIGG